MCVPARRFFLCAAGVLLSGHTRFIGVISYLFLPLNESQHVIRDQKKQAHSLVTRVYDHDGRETRSAHCPATPHVHAMSHSRCVAGTGVPVGGISALSLIPWGTPARCMPASSLLADHNQRRSPGSPSPSPPPSRSARDMPQSAANHVLVSSRLVAAPSTEAHDKPALCS